MEVSSQRIGGRGNRTCFCLKCHVRMTTFSENKNFFVTYSSYPSEFIRQITSCSLVPEHAMNALLQNRMNVKHHGNDIQINKNNQLCHGNNQQQRVDTNPKVDQTTIGLKSSARNIINADLQLIHSSSTIRIIPYYYHHIAFSYFRWFQ